MIFAVNEKTMKPTEIRLLVLVSHEWADSGQFVRSMQDGTLKRNHEEISENNTGFLGKIQAKCTKS